MLALVGIGITVAVYGVVALIVKADDIGVALAKNDSGSIAGRVSRAVGRALVLGMPGFLTFLSAVGTAAMIWVGGAIIVHGLEAFGVHSVGQAIELRRRSGSSRAAVCCRTGELDSDSLLIGDLWTDNRRDVDPGNRICRRPRMETAERHVAQTSVNGQPTKARPMKR